MTSNTQPSSKQPLSGYKMDNTARSPLATTLDTYEISPATAPINAGPLSQVPGSSSTSTQGPSTYTSRIKPCCKNCPDRNNPICEASCRRPSSIAHPAKWKKRLRHFTWAWFTMTMSTASLACCWHQIPYSFPAKREIGLTIYYLNLGLFVLFTLLIAARFTLYKSSLQNSWLHPTESLFIPCWLVTVGVMLVGWSMYLSDTSDTHYRLTAKICFWIYAILSLFISATSYLIMWATTSHTISSMTPQWIFPIYPCLIVGPLAGHLAAHESKEQALSILTAGVAVQGVGFLISLMVYSAFISRLMTDKLPHISLRPGMFISVGPSAFTIIGLMRMGEAVQTSHAFGDEVLGVEGGLAEGVVRIMSVIAGAWLYGLAVWFCGVTTAALIGHFTKPGASLWFRLNWWSFVFPNTALALATFELAEVFDSGALRIVGTVMVGILLSLWMGIFLRMLLAVRRREIMWEGKDEDREEGGFKGKINTSEKKGVMV